MWLCKQYYIYPEPCAQEHGHIIDVDDNDGDYDDVDADAAADDEADAAISPQNHKNFYLVTSARNGSSQVATGLLYCIISTIIVR